MRALVHGANDIASAVALALARAGFAILLVESPLPAVTRRSQSFADADERKLCPVRLLRTTGQHPNPAPRNRD